LNIKETFARTLCILALAAPIRASAQAEQVPIPQQPSVAPQIEIDGVGLVTLDGGLRRQTDAAGNRTSSSRVNLSDSALLLGISQRLYKAGGIGSFVLGGEATDQTNSGNINNQLFLQQGYVDYQDRHTETYLGRTNTPTKFIQFPTLRGDDLINFTDLPDPYSSGVNTEEPRYSNVAAVTLNQNLRDFVNLHVQHLIHSAADLHDDQGLDAYGINFLHEPPPGLEAIQKIVSYQIGYERQSIGQAQGGSANFIYGGGVINLRPSPVNRVTLSLQDIFSTGNRLTQFAVLPDTFRAGSNTTAASLAYLHSPFGKPGYQIALTAGYKSYQKVHDADSYGLALTGVKRLGDGFDLVGQYTYQHRNTALTAVSGGRSDNSIQVGFVMNFTTLFNNTIGPRRSLLNLQHQYIPQR
jgi:hypothetical protein